MQLKPEQAVRREVRGIKGKQRVEWVFNCIRCGVEMWIASWYLKRDRTGLCKPCAASDRCKKGLWSLRPFESLYNSGLLRRAKLGGISVSLTYEEFLEFTTIHECHYCGRFVPWISHGRQSPNHGYHLDRKDSTQGYSLENCVVACGMCNRIKNNHLSYEEMLRLSPVLREIMVARQWEIK